MGQPRRTDVSYMAVSQPVTTQAVKKIQLSSSSTLFLLPLVQILVNISSDLSKYCSAPPIFTVRENVAEL